MAALSIRSAAYCPMIKGVGFVTSMVYRAFASAAIALTVAVERISGTSRVIMELTTLSSRSCKLFCAATSGRVETKKQSIFDLMIGSGIIL